MAVVERVGAAFARGVPLKLALALENDLCVNEDSWQKAMQRHPEYVRSWEAKKADFYERSCRRLEEADDLANLRWLLERRFPHDFAKQPDPANVSVSVVISEKDLERARAKASKL